MIEILEVEDWHVGLDSSSDDGGHDDDGGSGDGSHLKCFIRPWPKRVQFDRFAEAKMMQASVGAALL
jgi:hypothetical protein